MASRSFGQNALRQKPYICARCVIRSSRNPRRHLSGSFITREIEKELAWKEQAKLIRDGKKKSMLTILEERGYIKQVAGGRDELDNLMIDKRIGAYCGIDPTAPSLHVGHLLPFMCTFWLYINGFPVVTLIGGATSRIGDPTGRNTPREQMQKPVRLANIASMHLQLRSLWVKVEAQARKFGYKKDLTWKRALRNNSDWHRNLSVTDFLRDIGGAFRIGEMLTRDTVKSRIDNGQGMSFSEFTYPLIQAWDWWEMYNQNGIQLQIGGSDQFGNIVAGIDAVNHLRKTYHDPAIRQEKDDPLMRPFGFTVPLLTTASGEKFGKSAGNAIWLDPNLTSPFDLYQFMVRTSDADVERYLKLFTFHSIEAIEEAMREHEKDQSKRIAQHMLARSFLDLVHGDQIAQQAEAEHRQVFGQAGKGVTIGNILAAKSNAINDNSLKSTEESETAGFVTPSLNKFAKPTTAMDMPAPSGRVALPRSLVMNYSFARILHAAGLTSSRSEAHRLIKSQGAYVGGAIARGGRVENDSELKWTVIDDFSPSWPQQFLVNNAVLMMRVGKWNVRICDVIDDEAFKAQGLGCPGWDWEEHAQKMAELNSKSQHNQNSLSNAS